MTSLQGAEVLVTGGAGFIGSHLVERLLADGVGSVRVLDNLTNGSPDNLVTAAQSPNFSLLVGDVRDENAVREAMSGRNVVFHLACLGVRHSLHGPVENHSVNATGTLTVLTVANDLHVDRFVYVSTSEVFGTAQYVPMDESHPTWPETVYGGSKLAGEAYARAFHRTYEMPVVVVRPFNTFGPRSHFEGDSGEVLPRTIVRVLAGKRPVVFGDGEQTRDFMFVTDTARAIAQLGANKAAVGRTINLGTGVEISVNELCATVADALRQPGLSPLHLDRRPGDVRRLLGDPSLMRALTGFEPTVAFADGVASLIAWLKETQAVDMLSRVQERNWLAPSTGMVK